MNGWNNLHVYYTNINELVLSCIEPFFNLQKWPGLRYFWGAPLCRRNPFKAAFTALLSALPSSRTRSFVTCKRSCKPGQVFLSRHIPPTSAARCCCLMVKIPLSTTIATG